MSEQARIIAEIHELVMNILKTGTATEQEGDKLDELEELLYEQKCFQKIDHAEHTYQGEEIATLFFSAHTSQAIEKMFACDITPDDFFGFIDYYYDEDHKDDHLKVMFSDAFITDINKQFKAL